MNLRDKALWPVFGLSLAICAIAGPAAAYIGPGAGLSAIGTVLAVVGAGLLLILGFVWYPVKRMLRRGKGSNAAADDTAMTDQK